VFCPNCGNLIEDGAPLCSKCGTSLAISKQGGTPHQKRKSKRKVFIAFTATLLIVALAVGAVFINGFGLLNMSNNTSLTNKQIEGVHAVEKEIENAVNKEDDVGKQITDAISIIEKQKEQGLVESFDVSYSSIDVIFSSGITYLFLPSFNDFVVNSNGNSNHPAILIGNCMKVITPSTNLTDNLTAGIASAEKAINNTGDFNSTLYQNEGVSLDVLKTAFKGQNIVMWSGHGGLSLSDGPTLLTGEKITVDKDKMLSDDLSKNRVIKHSNSGYYLITSKFIDKYYSPDDLSNCLLFFTTCDTGATNQFVDSLRAKGASTVLAFDYTVMQSYGNDMLKTFFEQLAKKDKNGKYINSARDALNTAYDKHGSSDSDDIFDAIRDLFINSKDWWNGQQPSRERGAMLILFGDGSYKLSNTKKAVTTESLTLTTRPPSATTTTKPLTSIPTMTSPQTTITAPPQTARPTTQPHITQPSVPYNNVGNFAIEGKWKNVGAYTFGQAQQGAIIIFNGTNCNFYSPQDTYAFYKNGNGYQLDVTSFLFAENLSFMVNIIDHDNIEIFNGSNTIQMRRVG